MRFLVQKALYCSESVKSWKCNVFFRIRTHRNLIKSCKKVYYGKAIWVSPNWRKESGRIETPDNCQSGNHCLEKREDCQKSGSRLRQFKRYAQALLSYKRGRMSETQSWWRGTPRRETRQQLWSRWSYYWKPATTSLRRNKKAMLQRRWRKLRLRWHGVSQPTNENMPVSARACWPKRLPLRSRHTGTLHQWTLLSH